MPQTQENIKSWEFPMAKRGVDLNSNIVEVHPEHCLTSQNLVYRNGMVKRLGMQSLIIPEGGSIGNDRITGLHRFYPYGGTTRTVASYGVGVSYYDEATKDWVAISAGQTNNLMTHFTTWTPASGGTHLYISNTTDTPKKWDGTTFSTVTAAPANTVQFLPYRDRLIALSASGAITWSDSHDDSSWSDGATTGALLDSSGKGLALHNSTNNDSGIESKVLIAGDEGMYLFSGTDMRTPASTGNYVLHKIFNIGCVSPKTMVWTPEGTIWLGTDRQVYLLPFDKARPVPIGDKIRAVTREGEKGIESIPKGYITEACAVYSDGYYKLSVTSSGGSYNDTQWWLDVSRLFRDEGDSTYGPWYGPMTGANINCFAVYSGGADDGKLIGGEASAQEDLYELNVDGVYGDGASAATIQIYYKTFYHPLGSYEFTKDVHKIEAELLDVLGTVNVTAHEITGAVSSTFSFGLSGSAVYWDDAYWGDEYWSSSKPTRQKQDFSPGLHVRRLSLTIDHSSGNDTFQLYALRAQAVENAQMYEVA